MARRRRRRARSPAEKKERGKGTGGFCDELLEAAAEDPEAEGESAGDGLLLLDEGGEGVLHPVEGPSEGGVGVVQGAEATVALRPRRLRLLNMQASPGK